MGAKGAEKHTASAHRVHSKKCTKCHATKPLSKFKPRPDGKYGRSSHCYTCRHKYPSHRRHNEAYAKRHSKASPVNIEKLSIYRALPATPMVSWLKKLRNFKRRKGGSLTPAWVSKWSAVTACPVAGLTFVLTGERANGAPHPLSPSLDRIDPKQGYTDENTRVVCNFVNVAKNAWPEEQFRMLVMSTASNLRH